VLLLLLLLLALGQQQPQTEPGKSSMWIMMCMGYLSVC
jgi:hypothetical protein